MAGENTNDSTVSGAYLWYTQHAHYNIQQSVAGENTNDSTVSGAYLWHTHNMLITTSSSQWQVRILTTPQSPEHTFDTHTNTLITTSSSQWQVRILTTPQSPEHTFDRHTNTFITKHSFIGLFSRTTWEHQHQKGKTILGFHEARVDKSFRMAVASAWPYANTLHLA